MAKTFTKRFWPGRWILMFCILMFGILMFGILMFGVAITRRLAYRVQSDTHPALEHTRRSAPRFGDRRAQFNRAFLQCMSMSRSDVKSDQTDFHPQGYL